MEQTCKTCFYAELPGEKFPCSDCSVAGVGDDNKYVRADVFLDELEVWGDSPPSGVIRDLERAIFYIKRAQGNI